MLPVERTGMYGTDLHQNCPAQDSQIGVQITKSIITSEYIFCVFFVDMSAIVDKPVYYYLAGDVGGTNSRFSLYEVDHGSVKFVCSGCR